jgi:hypothetical protein
LQESPHLPGIIKFEHLNHQRDENTETAAAETLIGQDQMRASNAMRKWIGAIPVLTNSCVSSEREKEIHDDKD